jgi:hypothetical protein
VKKDELTAIAARCAAATPGPWEQHKNGYSVWQGPYEDGTGSLICQVSFSEVGHEQMVYNGDFIAESRSDIPALLSHISELRAENERLRDIVHRLVPYAELCELDDEEDEADRAWALELADIHVPAVAKP